MKTLFKTKEDKRLFIIFILVFLLIGAISTVGIVSHYKQKDNPKHYKY